MSVKGYRRCFFAVFFGGAALPVQRLQRAAQAAYRGQHPDHNADSYDPAAQCEPMRSQTEPAMQSVGGTTTDRPNCVSHTR